MEMMERDGAKLALYRDGPDWDGRAFALGKIRFPSAETGAALLADAAARARAEGAAALIGPMDGNTWNSYRLVSESDGRPAFLMEPTSRPHDRAAFDAAGFAPIGQYFSADLPLTQTLDTPAPGTLTIQPWDGTDAEALFAQVHALSSTAFAGNAFYKPIALDAFLAQYMPIVPMLKEELILFARSPSGDLVGFLFGVPDYAQGPKPRSAILKTYASLEPGAGRQLSAAFHAAARAAGYENAIHALIHDDNRSAEQSAAYGATIFRRYVLMGRRLE